MKRILRATTISKSNQSWLLGFLLSTLLMACPNPPPPMPTISSISLSPELATISSDQTIVLSATIQSNLPTELNWEILEKSGVLAEFGPNQVTFRPPNDLLQPTRFTIKVSAKKDTTKSAIAKIDVIPNVSGIQIRSNQAQLLVNQRTSLGASVTGGDQNAVQWEIIQGNGKLSATTGSSIEFIAPTTAAETSTTIQVMSTINPNQQALIVLETRPIRKKVASNDYHALVIQSNGALFAWGNNDSGAIGTGKDGDQRLPAAINTPEKILTVAAGAQHSLAVGISGRLYAWGDNENGALGLDDPNITPIPTATTLENISQVAAGAQHSLALSRNGLVYAWGANNDGQLGLGENISKTSTPTLISSLDKIVFITANAWRSMALRQDGKVFIWGDEADASNSQDQYQPRELENLKDIVEIALGWQHSLALDRDGNVFGWGLNEFRATGQQNVAYVNIPQKITNLTKIKTIAAGFNHSLCIKQNNEVIAWGSNYYGQLGIAPDLISFQAEGTTVLPDATSISSGTNHSFAVSQGNLYGWGSNTFGQLGLGSRTDIESPKFILQNIAQP
jgi:alpha-tubulin suppressor-like RCC1 family protein